jgi:hypothetical protein
MKKAFLIVALFFFLLGMGIFHCEAQTVTYKTLLIGQNLRMVATYADKDGLHFQYFTEPRAGEGPKFLGEEIFKNGEKTFDTYREND